MNKLFFFRVVCAVAILTCAFAQSAAFTRVWPSGTNGVGSASFPAARAAVFLSRTAILDGAYIGDPALRSDGMAAFATQQHVYAQLPGSSSPHLVQSAGSRAAGVHCVSGPVLSQDGLLFAVGYSDGTISAFNASSAAFPLLWTSMPLSGSIFSLSFSSNDALLFATTNGGGYGGFCFCCGYQNGFSSMGPLVALSRASGSIAWSYVTPFPCWTRDGQNCPAGNPAIVTGSIDPFWAVSPQPTSASPSPPAAIAGWQQMKMVSGFSCSSPVFTGNLIAFSGTGSILWNLPFAAGVTTAPFINPSNTLVYVGSGPALFSVSIASGQIQTSFQSQLSSILSPVVASSMVFALSGNSILTAWNVSSSVQSWSVNLFENYVGAYPVVSLNSLSLYVTTSSGVRAFDQTTGSALWNILTPSGVSSGIAIGVNGDLVLGASNGRISFFSTCKAGSYCPLSLQAAFPCASSTADQATCSTATSNCPAGTFPTGFGASCTPCPAGTFSLAGATACALCLAGSFGSSAGLTSAACSGTCASCAAGATTPPAALSCTSAGARAVPPGLGLFLWPAAHPQNTQGVDLAVAPLAKCQQLGGACNTQASSTIMAADGSTLLYVVGTAAALHLEAAEEIACTTQ